MNQLTLSFRYPHSSLSLIVGAVDDIRALSDPFAIPCHVKTAHMKCVRYFMLFHVRMNACYVCEHVCIRFKVYFHLPTSCQHIPIGRRKRHGVTFDGGRSQ